MFIDIVYLYIFKIRILEYNWLVGSNIDIGTKKSNVVFSIKFKYDCESIPFRKKNFTLKLFLMTLLR